MAEGAALEMPCTGNRTVGSNPTPSAIPAFELMSMPVGEKGPVARRRPKDATEAHGPYRCIETLPRGEKDPDARRRRMAAREAYSLYVERAAAGANEADGFLSTRGAGGPC